MGFLYVIWKCLKKLLGKEKSGKRNPKPILLCLEICWLEMYRIVLRLSWYSLLLIVFLILCSPIETLALSCIINLKKTCWFSLATDFERCFYQRWGLFKLSNLWILGKQKALLLKCHVEGRSLVRVACSLSYSVEFHFIFIQVYSLSFL